MDWWLTAGSGTTSLMIHRGSHLELPKLRLFICHRPLEEHLVLITPLVSVAAMVPASAPPGPFQSIITTCNLVESTIPGGLLEFLPSALVPQP